MVPERLLPDSVSRYWNLRVLRTASSLPERAPYLPEMVASLQNVHVILVESLHFVHVTRSSAVSVRNDARHLRIRCRYIATDRAVHREQGGTQADSHRHQGLQGDTRRGSVLRRQDAADRLRPVEERNRRLPVHTSEEIREVHESQHDGCVLQREIRRQPVVRRPTDCPYGAGTTCRERTFPSFHRTPVLQ